MTLPLNNRHRNTKMMMIMQRQKENADKMLLQEKFSRDSWNRRKHNRKERVKTNGSDYSVSFYIALFFSNRKSASILQTAREAKAIKSLFDCLTYMSTPLIVVLLVLFSFLLEKYPPPSS